MNTEDFFIPDRPAIPDPTQRPVYRERWNGHLAEVYINTTTGGYRIFVDHKEYECGWYQLTHASEEARLIAMKVDEL